MPDIYYFGRYDQRPFCWVCRTPPFDKPYFLQNERDLGLDSENQVLLKCLLEAFPERPTLSAVQSALSSINLGPSQLSQKKNYLINRFDRALQKILGLTPPGLEFFQAGDRRLIEFTRSQPPQFIPDILQFSFVPQDSSEKALLHFYLLRLGQLRSASRLLERLNQEVSKELCQIIENAQRLQLISYLAELRLEKLNSSQIQCLLLWLHALLMDSDSVYSSAGLFLRKEIELLHKNILEHFFHQNPHLLYVKTQVLVENPHLSPQQLLLKQTKKLAELERIEYQSFSLNRENNHVSLRKKFSLNYLDQPCSEPDWNYWLITPQEICEIERQAHTVWILTSHFMFDNNLPWITFLEMYCENLRNNTRYVYFYPPEIEHHAICLRERCYFQFAHNVPLLIAVPELTSIFRFQATEMALYDPEDPDSPWHQGYELDIFDSLSDYHLPNDSFPTVHQRIPPKRLGQMIQWCQAHIYQFQNNHV